MKYIILGHEIHPCVDNYSKDTCQPCAKGYVQPEYISSSEDLNKTRCFKLEHKCRAHGKIYFLKKSYYIAHLYVTETDMDRLGSRNK